MERVTGIGGVFFKADYPKALTDWYRRHLGVPVGAGGHAFFPGRKRRIASASARRSGRRFLAIRNTSSRAPRPS